MPKTETCGRCLAGAYPIVTRLLRPCLLRQQTSRGMIRELGPHQQGLSFKFACNREPETILFEKGRVIG